MREETDACVSTRERASEKASAMLLPSRSLAKPVPRKSRTLAHTGVFARVLYNIYVGRDESSRVGGGKK